MKPNQPKTINRYLPLRGTRRRNGLIIVDDESGRAIQIRLHRGKSRDQVRVAIRGDHIHVEIEDGGNAS